MRKTALVTSRPDVLLMELVAIVATVRDLPVDGCQPVACKIARILATYQELVERPPGKPDEEPDEDEW